MSSVTVEDELRRQLVEEKESHRRTILALGQAEAKLAEREKSLLILKVRSRIEELEKKFLPGHMRNDTRYNKWRNILWSPAQNLRNSAELLQFRSLITMNQNSFISTVCDLYGDFSDIAAHKILFPIAYDRNSITQMFQDVGLTPDGAKIDSVEVILTPIPTP